MTQLQQLAILVLTLSSLNIYAQFGPGGVGDATTNKLWLRADQGLIVDGTVVLSSLDEDGNGNNPLGFDPIYSHSVGAFNNLPAIRFPESGHYKNIFDLSSQNFTVFTVHTMVESSRVPLWTTDNAEQGYLPNSNGGAHFLNNCGYSKTDLPVAIGEATVSTIRYTENGSEFYFDGKREVNSGFSFCSNRMGSFSIGGSTSDGVFQGDLAEIFFFEGSINIAQRIIIENYLAAKYGLNTENDIYKHGLTHPHDVTGIGNKDNLKHDDSQGTGIVRISDPTNLGNGEYLFLGHNNGDIKDYVFDCGSVFLGRTWKVSEAGEVGTVKLRFEATELPDNGSELELLIDRDGDGFTDETPITGLIVGSYLEFDNVDLEKDNLFTLGHVISDYHAENSGLSDDEIWSINGTSSEMEVEFCPEVSLVIPAGRTVLSNLAEIVCKDFVVEPGASFDMGTGGSKIIVHGNWQNNGTFIPGNGEISFEGNEDQLIDNNGVQEWGSLTVNNSEEVIVTSGTHRINGTLNIVDGKFRTNDEVVLASSANGTARLAEMVNGELIGQITVERFMNTIYNDWHLICSPIEGIDYEAWDDDLITTGIPGSDYPTNWFKSIRTYDETVEGHKDLGISSPSSMTEPISDLLGAWVYIPNGNQKFEAKGNVYCGDFSFPITYTDSDSPLDDGWNLLGNPYPSVIDWDDPSWDKTNVNDAIYVWDPALQQYNSYIGGVGINGGSQFIPSGQAFWIQTNKGGPNLKIREQAKTAQIAGYKSIDNLDFLKLVVTNGSMTDETAIRIADNSDGGFEASRDAVKFSTPNENAPNIRSWSSDSVLLSINTMPFGQNFSLDIPLEVSGKEGDEFTIDAINNFQESRCVFLEDVYTGETIDIMNESYTFENINAEANRFVLHISQLINVTAIPVGCNNDLGGELIIEAFGIAPWTLELTDENDLPVAYAQTSTGFNATNLTPGFYEIKFGNENELCKSTTREIEILGKNPVSADFSMKPALIDLKFTDEVHFTNASENADEYLWNFGNGLYGIEESPINTYSVKGDYEVTLSATSGACSSLEKKKLTVIDTRISIEPNSNITPAINLVSKDGILKAMKMSENDISQLRVYSVSGQLLHTQNWDRSREDMLVYLPPTFNLLIVSVMGLDGSVISTDRIIH